MSSKRARDADVDSGSDEYNGSSSMPPSPEAVVPVKRGRGRPPNSSKLARNDISRDRRHSRQDKNGNQGHSHNAQNEPDQSYALVNDEYVLEEDPAGETKVDHNGQLQGGRDYRVRTFTLSTRGDRLYMLSTEPARCIGFRDSYLLFQKHRTLCKVVLTDEEKFELIDRGLIPHSYKGRVIGVVTARSIFREFGARIIIGGHRVVDDYYEAKAIAAGHKQSELADPDDRLPPSGQQYSKNQYVAWHGASSVYHQPVLSIPGGPAVVSSTSGATPSYGGYYSGNSSTMLDPADVTWLAEAAQAVVRTNKTFSHRRAPLRNPAGLLEPHTGVPFIAKTTQSTNCKVYHTPTTTGSNRLVISYSLRLEESSHKSPKE